MRAKLTLPRHEAVEVAFWTALNLVLAVAFSLLLLLDDRAAHAAGL